MNFGDVMVLAASLPCFDLSLLVQASGEGRGGLAVQLSRWMADGKVVSLRRGVYTLADRFRKVRVSQAVLACELCRPSYLSGLWALSYHGLIPEMTVVLTGVTSRAPQRFENAFGTFDYRHIKQALFFGYRRVDTDEGWFFVAEPEKALLDHWHLTSGEWTSARLEEMRYQNPGAIDWARLEDYVARAASPRLKRTVARFERLIRREQEGEAEL